VNHSNGDSYLYTYDAVGNRLTETTQNTVNNYQYDSANRLTSVNSVNYTFDDNGNLLSDGTNTYTYDSANRLISVSNQSSVDSYQYNGLGDRLVQNNTQYTLDLNSGLTQVLDDGTSTYTYGLGRISQTNTDTEYFLGDALGSVRQMTDTAGEITLVKNYAPYGTTSQSAGDSQSAYGFTGEYTDSTGNIYLRARYYNPLEGRFMSRDTWEGNYNSPQSLNRWNYVEGNPINYTDPSGNMPETNKQILIGTLPNLQNFQFLTSEINILNFILGDCPPNSKPINTRSDIRYDLTGYLALSMSKHGQDARVKAIAYQLKLANLYGKVSDLARTALWVSAYRAFEKLEGGGKEWDIKIEIQQKLRDGIVLCGEKNNCRWLDYSTPGNIHFGYVAGLAKIDYFAAALVGGLLEQKDLFDNNLPLEPLYCFQNALPGFCDNPADQAAVDFGYKLAVNYKNGISDQQLRQELQSNGMNNFQKPPSGFIPPYRAAPESNIYGPDYFNCYACKKDD
jgi:RHS repeat-associated protein